MDAEVWIIHSRRRVLVSDLPGPPVGNGTLGDVAFVGRWPLPNCGWGEAGRVAALRAGELGYRVSVETWGVVDEDVMEGDCD